MAGKWYYHLPPDESFRVASISQRSVNDAGGGGGDDDDVIPFKDSERGTLV